MHLLWAWEAQERVQTIIDRYKAKDLVALKPTFENSVLMLGEFKEGAIFIHDLRVSINRLEELTLQRIEAERDNDHSGGNALGTKDMSYTPWAKQEISKAILFEEIDKYFKAWADRAKDKIEALAETKKE